MSGWIKLHRQLAGNPMWLAEPFTRGQAWADLLMLANYKPGHIRIAGQRVDVPVGAVSWSKGKLADRWKWSKGKLQRFLKELENDNQIIIKAGHRISLISICNYDQYQKNESPDRTPDGSPDESPDRSPDRPPDESPDGSPDGSHKRSKEEKEGKEVKNSPSSTRERIDFAQHLIDQHHYDPIRTKTSHLTQYRQWNDDGVTLAELDAAVPEARKTLGAKGETNDPPVRYLASVIASTRQRANAKPVTAGPADTRDYDSKNYDSPMAKNFGKPVPA